MVRVKVDRSEIQEEVRWHVELPNDTEHNSVTWYVDGSLLDGPRVMMASTGAGFAGISPTGALLAYGDATPPSWITTIPGVEAWTLQIILGATTSQAAIVTDCLGNVSTYERGKEYATGPKRLLARVWHPIMTAANECCTKLIWMPAHTTAAAVGARRRSDGKAISPIDHRANSLVDMLAKKAAILVRLPSYIRDTFEQAEAAFEHAAALLGVVTKVANGLTLEGKIRDETDSEHTKRDSMPSSMLARSSARRDQMERRRKEKERMMKETAEKAVTDEANRKRARKEALDLEAADHQRRMVAADKLLRTCAKDGDEDEELEAFWNSLDPSLVAEERHEDESVGNLFVTEPTFTAPARHAPTPSRLAKATALRDPTKTAANNAKQNERRAAERKAAKGTTRGYSGIAADPGAPGSVRGAKAPSPVGKAGSSKEVNPAQGTEGRLLGAVAEFWERKQAKARLSRS